MITADDLRVSPLLADQPAEHLAWFAETARELRAQAGEKPFGRGDAADEMIVVLEGTFEVYAFPGGTRTLFGTMTPGTITGLLPFSRMETYEGEGVATEPTRLALLHRDALPELLERMPEVGTRLVAQMTDRVRESSRTEQQREKMVSLGKLAAGLAHELNNPASAVQRAAKDLRERVEAYPALAERLSGHGLTPPQLQAARAALQSCAAPLPGTVSALDRADHEDALADWLDDHGVPGAAMLSETLADEGVSRPALDELAASVPPDALGDVIAWIEKGLATERLLRDIESASARVSELVAAVKGYTHLDAAPVRQTVRLADGLDQTLTMLGHAIRDKQITLRRELDGLPPVLAVPGELNQVWTNLLDNAIDAVAPGGQIQLAGRADGDVVRVSVVDDGAGIPPEVRDRLFEPFVTTKPPGEGTGLGLDIARRIVEQHAGTLSVESEPGRTAFTVTLPAA